MLVCLHDVELSQTTDVADHPELANRRTTKVVNGRSQTGWFAEDLTLAEVKTLRAKERLPQLRPQNTAYDGKYEVPTFAEVLALRASLAEQTGHTVGIYQLKMPTHFREVDALEPVFVEQLRAAGLDSATAPVFVQSFEPTSLRRLKADLGVRAPADLPQLPSGAPSTLSSWATRARTPTSTPRRDWPGCRGSCRSWRPTRGRSCLAARTAGSASRRPSLPASGPPACACTSTRCAARTPSCRSTTGSAPTRPPTGAPRTWTPCSSRPGRTRSCDQPDLCVAARKGLPLKRTYAPRR